jgi:hypothetical protein
MYTSIRIYVCGRGAGESPVFRCFSFVLQITYPPVSTHTQSWYPQFLMYFNSWFEILVTRCIRYGASRQSSIWISCTFDWVVGLEEVLTSYGWINERMVGWLHNSCNDTVCSVPQVTTVLTPAFYDCLSSRFIPSFPRF